MLKKSLKPRVSHISNSEEETMLYGQRLAQKLKPGDVVLLKGDLGSGKTTFAKGMARGFNVNPRRVNSPTFVLMNYYKGKLPFYHFDLYRLDSPPAVDTLEFDEYFYGPGVSVVEWPEHLGSHRPKFFYQVAFKHKGEHRRQICISYPLRLPPKSSH